MTREGRDIYVRGATYVVSSALPPRGNTRHLLINQRSDLAVLIGRFHLGDATIVPNRPDAFVIEDVEIYPNEIVAYAPADAPWRHAMSRAEELTNREDAEDAVWWLRKELQENPDHCVALHALAAAYLHLADIAGVLAMEKRAIEVEPCHELYRRGYVHACSHPTTVSAFEQALRDYLQLFPQRCVRCDRLEDVQGGRQR